MNNNNKNSKNSINSPTYNITRYVGTRSQQKCAARRYHAYKKKSRL